MDERATTRADCTEERTGVPPAEASVSEASSVTMAWKDGQGGHTWMAWH